MLLAKTIYALSLEYSDDIWSDTEDIISFFLISLITFVVIPLILGLDIILFPIEIYIFLIRKHYENELGNEYTFKDFIKEDVY